MMKRIVVLIILMMTVNVLVNAQTKYITHTIAAGETLSALSAKYKTTVGDIMRLNGMHADSKLSIGQAIKIPTSGAGAVKSAAATTTTPVVKPVTKPAAAVSGAATVHTVQPGETLYRIATKYHVKVDQVKAWNNLAGDNVSVGQQLYINGAAPAGDIATTPKPVQPQPAQQQPVQQPVQQQQQPVAQQPTPEAPVTPAPKPAAVVTTPAATQPAPGKDMPYVDPAKVSAKGYFESLYGIDVSGRSETTASGAAMTFKTSSGWTDKKYYILMNDIAPGSIVKITYPASNKTIYAKVLWNMGSLKENEGLNFRISNAAADALGVTELKFQISVAYFD